jgi:hypothetical protein
MDLISLASGIAYIISSPHKYVQSPHQYFTPEKETVNEEYTKPFLSFKEQVAISYEVFPL